MKESLGGSAGSPSKTRKASTSSVSVSRFLMEPPNVPPGRHCVLPLRVSAFIPVSFLICILLSSQILLQLRFLLGPRTTGGTRPTE